MSTHSVNMVLSSQNARCRNYALIHPTICSITSWLRCSHCNFASFTESYVQILIFFGERESRFQILNKNDLYKDKTQSQTQ